MNAGLQLFYFPFIDRKDAKSINESLYQSINRIYQSITRIYQSIETVLSNCGQLSFICILPLHSMRSILNWEIVSDFESMDPYTRKKRNK